MRRFWAALPLIALVALIAVSGFILLRGEPRETLSAGLIGQPAPSFALASLDGDGLATSDAFAGRPYVINLFASWCTPCRAEHPELLRLQAQGAAVLGVAYKDRPERTRAYLNELGDPYELVVLDPEGRYGLELGASGVPETFLVGADGRILASFRGPVTARDVDERILPALSARAP